MKFDKSLNLFSWHVARVGFFRAQNKIDIAVALISSGCYIDCLHGCGNIYAQNAVTNTTAATASRPHLRKKH